MPTTIQASAVNARDLPEGYYRILTSTFHNGRLYLVVLGKETDEYDNPKFVFIPRDSTQTAGESYILLQVKWRKIVLLTEDYREERVC